MNWHSLIRGMLAEENPELHSRLSRSKDEHENYVNDVARRTRESYETVTANVTDPASWMRPGRSRSHRRKKRSPI